MIANY